MTDIRHLGKAELKTVSSFLAKHWAADHFLITQTKSLEAIFVKEEVLFGYGAFNGNTLKAIWLYLPYDEDCNGIAGGIWLAPPILSDDKILGLKIMMHGLRELNSDYVITPGVGSKMRYVHQKMGYQWRSTSQFYFGGRAFFQTPSIDVLQSNLSKDRGISWEKRKFFEAQENSFLMAKTYPKKDIWYLERRYDRCYDQPFSTYFLTDGYKNFAALTVLGLKYQNKSVLRLYDYTGPGEFLKLALQFLQSLAKDLQVDHCDAVLYMSDYSVLYELDFKLAINNEVPSKFFPYDADRSDTNVAFMVRDKSIEPDLLICKGDGDQFIPRILLNNAYLNMEK